MSTLSSFRRVLPAVILAVLGVALAATAQPGIVGQLPPQTTRTVAVFGYVKTGDGTPVSGVQIKVTSAQDQSKGVVVTTNENGLYHTYTPAGSYYVVAAKEGYTFDPATGTVTVPTTGEAHSPYGEVDFQATATGTTTPTDSKFGPFGYIKTAGGEPISGVTVTVTPDGGDGTAVTCTTDDKGLYHVHVPAGTYHVVPAKTGYTFTPTGGSVTLPTTGEKSSPYAELDFTASNGTTTTPEKEPGLYGYVKDADGKPIGGVTVRITMGAKTVTATTSSQGLYYTHLPAGTYQVVPTKAGFTFAPAAGTVTLPTTGRSNSPYGEVDFTAQAAAAN